MNDRPGLTVSPVMSVDDQGNEVVTDFAVQGHEGGTWTDPNDIYEDAEGTLHHVYEDVQLDTPGSESEADQMLVDGINELYPNIDQMLAFASDNYDADTLDRYNAAIDVFDVDVVFPFLEQLEQDFNAAGEPEFELEDGEDLDPATVDEWFDSLPDETLDEMVDDLYEQPFDDEAFDLYSTAHLEFPDDSVESAILMQGMLIANGNTTLDQAIEDVLGQFSEADAASAYLRLQNVFNS